MVAVMLIGIASAQTKGVSTAFVNDTTTNTETVYLALASANNLSLDYKVTLSVTPVNVSGTATVTCMPQGKNGAGWYDLQAAADTVNNAGTVATKTYSYANAYYDQYRLKLVSTGTGVANHSGAMLIK